MKKMFSVIFISLLIIPLISGCTTRVIDFTAISTKNCNIQGERGEKVVGEDRGGFFLFIPIIPNIEDAIDNALEKSKSDVLVDGVIYHYFYHFILFGISGYRVEGTPVKTQHVAEKL